ncbi:MAG TPA: DUF4136 domain-containing protein [Steroidobacteraceae bacterium]|nr:DUF4136 domain-containing protein [Steroidobacteraceae bacterium]
MSRKLSVSLSLALLFLAFDLRAQEVNIEFDETTDFTQFKTFAIREGHITSRAPALNSPLTKKRLQAEIEKALTSRGLSATEGAADLDVSWEFGSARKLDTQAYPTGWHGRGTRVVQVQKSEGTLVVDLLATSTKQLVWRGIAADSERNPQKLADKLDNLAKKSIGKYPPKNKKK